MHRNTSSSNAFVVQGLQSSSQYSFRVAASNANGLGPYSAPVTVTTRTTGPPTQPQAPIASKYGRDYIQVSGTAPSDDGGLPILGWLFANSTDGITAWGNFSSAQSKWTYPNEFLVIFICLINEGILACISILHTTTK